MDFDAIDRVLAAANREAEFRALNGILAEQFAISPPGLQWTMRTERGWYHPVPGFIVMGPRCHRGVDNVFAHEWAHHLWFVERDQGIHTEPNTECHGWHFVDCLIRVLWRLNGRYDSYAWDTEYEGIRRIVIKMGVWNGVITRKKDKEKLDPPGFHASIDISSLKNSVA